MKLQNLPHILIWILCIALLPRAQAVSPTPDGCYPNFTTAEGCGALNLLTTGVANTGLGWRSLFSDSTGSFNTGVGTGTLVLNTADSNTAVGAAALLLNTSGTENTAIGAAALEFNTSGGDNTAVGAFALQNNTGETNTAIGSRALLNDTSGGANTAVGVFALHNNTTGNNNVAIGNSALFASTTGNGKTAIGINTLPVNTGDFNIALGASAGSNQDTGNNDIYIGDSGAPGESNVIAIGAIASSGTAYTETFIGGVFGAPVNADSATAVFVDDTGKLGTLLVGDKGNRRNKVAVPAVHGAQSRATLHELRRAEGRIVELEGMVASLAATVKEQTSQIQKVSAELELSKTAPQTVANDH